MMRIAIMVLIAIHGIIHLFGLLKAFNISEFNAISQPISKVWGVLWLLVFLLFATTVILRLIDFDYWWLSGFLAVASSQVLIFHYWSDAKYGTVANLIILFVTIIGYSSFSFKKTVKEERKALFEHSQPMGQETISAASLDTLPTMVQKWLQNAGVVGTQPISNVFLTQAIQLKLRPTDKKWTVGSSEQYFTIQPPAFNWNIDAEVNSLLSVVGRDRFTHGKGAMTIRLLSLIPVVNVENDGKINQATLQRYLAEIIWFPSAALSHYIRWEAIDHYSARAIMEYEGTRGSGVFHFDEEGNFKRFVTMRYKGPKDTRATEWTVKATKIKEMNGIKIPVECEASWELETGTWTWLKLKVTDIQYNRSS